MTAFHRQIELSSVYIVFYIITSWTTKSKINPLLISF